MFPSVYALSRSSARSAQRLRDNTIAAKGIRTKSETADRRFDIYAQVWYIIAQPNSTTFNGCEEDEYALDRWFRERGTGESPAHAPAPNGPRSCRANAKPDGLVPVACAGVATVIRAKSISRAATLRPYSNE